MTRSPLLLVAEEELRLAVRSRWTQVFAVVFAALSLAVAARSGNENAGVNGARLRESSAVGTSDP